MLRTYISDGSWFRSKYNSVNNITKLRYCYNDVTRAVEYEYGEDNILYGVLFNGSAQILLNNDNLGRRKRIDYINASAENDSYVQYGYRDWQSDDERTTGIIQTEKYHVNGGTTLSNKYYEYDRNGNITRIHKGTNDGEILVQCEYDSRNRLVRYDNKGDHSYTYEYDHNGNIENKKEYDFTTGALGPETSTINYSYSNSNWKDLLTSYNGLSISYDSIGNMTSYNGTSFSWQGRRLTSITSGTNNYSYTYSADGVRTSKTVNGTTTEYFLNGDQILAQKTGDSVLWFFYDSEGTRVGLVRNGISYYYLYNITGDVIGIMRASDGVVVSTYTYDAWGKCSLHNSSGTTIGTANPFRYKGYYFDSETGMYYLNNRYYNPEFGRFISADSVGVLSIDTTINGTNLFAYCNNNPVMYIDNEGELAQFAVIAGGAFVGMAINTMSYLLTMDEFDMIELSFAMIEGAAEGALATVKMSTGATVLASMGIGVLCGVAKEYVNNGASGDFDLAAGAGMIDGAISGGIGVVMRAGIDGKELANNVNSLNKKIAKNSRRANQKYADKINRKLKQQKRAEAVKTGASVIRYAVAKNASIKMQQSLAYQKYRYK